MSHAVDPSAGEARALEAAQRGDVAAFNQIVLAYQTVVYNVALRTLGNPTDAEDATQEILIKVLTHLGSFRQESAFRTWVFRIAANHLLTMRKRRAERAELSFDLFAEDLGRGLSDAPYRG